MKERALGDTIFIPFTTRQFSDGVPTTLAGSPVVTGHRDANLTQFTTGITTDIDFDAIGGLNMITIVATTANGYIVGETYTLYLSAGTVGGVSVVGEVVGEFRLTAQGAAALEIIPGTVDTVTNSHTPTTVEFQADDITEATANHFAGRTVYFTSGVLKSQATTISAYAAVGGIGQFTVAEMTEPPANNDTFVIA